MPYTQDLVYTLGVPFQLASRTFLIKCSALIPGGACSILGTSTSTTHVVHRYALAEQDFRTARINRSLETIGFALASLALEP